MAGIAESALRPTRRCRRCRRADRQLEVSARSQNRRIGVQPVATGMFRQRSSASSWRVEAGEVGVDEDGVARQSDDGVRVELGRAGQQPLRETPPPGRPRPGGRGRCTAQAGSEAGRAQGRHRAHPRSSRAHGGRPGAASEVGSNAALTPAASALSVTGSSPGSPASKRPELAEQREEVALRAVGGTGHPGGERAQAPEEVLGGRRRRAAARTAGGLATGERGQHLHPTGRARPAPAAWAARSPACPPRLGCRRPCASRARPRRRSAG